MKHLIKLAAIGVIGVIGFAVTGCQVNKTQDAKLPGVKVEATKGQLPHYNVQGSKVEVGEKTATVKVPTIKVTTPDKKG